MRLDLMTWPEVDFETRLWTVPAARMKGGVEHRVPLTDEMLALLEPLRAMAGSITESSLKSVSCRASSPSKVRS